MTHQFPVMTRLGLGGVALLLVLAGSALPAVASPADTARSTAPPTVEEQRLDRAVPREILRRSGFDALARASPTPWRAPAAMRRRSGW